MKQEQQPGNNNSEELLLIRAINELNNSLLIHRHNAVRAATQRERVILTHSKDVIRDVHFLPLYKSRSSYYKPALISMNELLETDATDVPGTIERAVTNSELAKELFISQVQHSPNLQPILRIIAETLVDQLEQVLADIPKDLSEERKLKRKRQSSDEKLDAFSNFSTEEYEILVAGFVACLRKNQNFIWNLLTFLSEDNRQVTFDAASFLTHEEFAHFFDLIAAGEITNDTIFDFTDRAMFAFRRLRARIRKESLPQRPQVAAVARMISSFADPKYIGREMTQRSLAVEDIDTQKRLVNNTNLGGRQTKKYRAVRDMIEIQEALNDLQSFVERRQVELNRPVLDPETDNAWIVQTCAPWYIKLREIYASIPKDVLTFAAVQQKDMAEDPNERLRVDDTNFVKAIIESGSDTNLVRYTILQLEEILRQNMNFLGNVMTDIRVNEQKVRYRKDNVTPAYYGSASETNILRIYNNLFDIHAEIDKFLVKVGKKEEEINTQTLALLQQAARDFGDKQATPGELLDKVAQMLNRDGETAYTRPTTDPKNEEEMPLDELLKTQGSVQKRAGTN